MTHESMTWSLGVDFGTAFSKAAAMRFQGDRLVGATPLAIGRAAGWTKPYLAPSILFLDGGAIYFGSGALERFASLGLAGREVAQSLKMMLGARSYQETLNYFPRPSIDPDRLFKVRELIVLYLAHLLRLIDGALEEVIEGPEARAQASLRFCRPGWLPEQDAAAHEVMVALFEDAHRVKARLGAALGAAEGLAYGLAREALEVCGAPEARFVKLDGGIYEASAVALCHFNDARTPDRIVIVDVGAGTTDVAGLVKRYADGAIKVVRQSRRTIDVAGDHLDAALLNFLVERARGVQTGAQKQRLWRWLSPQVRDLKEELFAKGSVCIAYEGGEARCRAADLERAPAFREAIAAIGRLYEACVKDLADDARREGSKRLGVLLTGGGAHVPALRRAIQARRSAAFGVRVEHLERAPAWFDAIDDGLLAPVFAQLSPACGAALSRVLCR